VTSFFGGLTGSVDIDIILDKKINQKIFKYRTKKGERIKLPVYEANDDITGIVQLSLKDTKKYEHLGLKISIIGYLGIF
jgi:vacuolar protein sorting-associated protein 26